MTSSNIDSNANILDPHMWMTQAQPCHSLNLLLLWPPHEACHLTPNRKQWLSKLRRLEFLFLRTPNISLWQYSDLFCPQIQLDYLQAESPMGTHNKHIPPNIHVSSQLPFLASWSLFMLQLLSTTVCQLLSTTVSQVWSKISMTKGEFCFVFHAENIFSCPLIISHVSMHFYHIYSPPLSYLTSPPGAPFLPNSFSSYFHVFKTKTKQKETTCWVWWGWLPHPWVWGYFPIEAQRNLSIATH